FSLLSVITDKKGKSHAEGSVSYASTWILAALRNETFFSLADAKEAVAEKLKELNGYTFKNLEGNRRDAYIHEEKAFMQPLPVNPLYCKNKYSFLRHSYRIL